MKIIYETPSHPTLRHRYRVEGIKPGYDWFPKGTRRTKLGACLLAAGYERIGYKVRILDTKEEK